MISSAIAEDHAKTLDNIIKVVSAASTQAVQDGAYPLNAPQAHISATTVEFPPKVTAPPKQPPSVTLMSVLKHSACKPERLLQASTLERRKLEYTNTTIAKPNDYIFQA